jgi:heme/copper-type cytochrome/quinol oxidase subunit 2
MRLLKEGKGVVEIKAAIDGKYANSAHNIPTAMKRKSLVFWTLIGGAALHRLVPLPPGSQAATRVFRVEARQFEYSPAAFRVNPGDTVTIQLVSTDVVHGLYLDGYGVSVTADPGQTAELTFIADRAGAFRLRCNVTCGAMHPFMIGKLTVGTNEWLYRSISLALLAMVGLFSFVDIRAQNAVAQQDMRTGIH